MRHRRFLLQFILALLCVANFFSNARSAVTEVRPDELSNNNVKTIRITYSGGIAVDGVMDFMSTLDKVNMKYPAGERIILYINSGGGGYE